MKKAEMLPNPKIPRLPTKYTMDMDINSEINFPLRVGDEMPCHSLFEHCDYVHA